MNNKTCGECKHCENKKVIATCKYNGIVTGDIHACSKFELKAVTNGDRIRQMSNEELALFFDQPQCHICPYENKETYFCGATENESCQTGILAWLNAPAESEEEQWGK